MNRILTASLVCMLIAGGHALAQDKTADHPASTTAATTSTPATAMTEGEVRKVDKAAGKITLKHGEIKNLEMPPMSMVFQVQDPALLDKVKVGDKVKFTAARIKGAITVLSIEKTR